MMHDIAVKERAPLEVLEEKLRQKTALIGVVGLGYVGLPICIAACESGSNVLGFDVDSEKPRALADGRSYLQHIPDDRISPLVRQKRLTATTDFTRLSEPDALLICVPTPLSPHLEPDLSFIETTGEQIATRLRRGQIVVLESTTYPGTTAEVLRPILERSGLVCDEDFYLAFSPEREDPGNADFSTARIPKVVGADSPATVRLATTLYEQFVPKTVPVSSSATAEAVKLTENIFRAVNIALVNELKLVFGAMDIDVWEVIEAAKSKPFGFMPFYPGPGLGGHCIPIDPFYLTWKAREYGVATRFIELAGQINSAMPQHVVNELARALDAVHGRGLTRARILVLGVAYKKNVDDTRESPSLRLMDLLEARGAEVRFFDPFVKVIPVTREHKSLSGRRSEVWDPVEFGRYDAILVATDHDDVDYAALALHAPLIVDTRNACRKKGVTSPNVVPA
jgi:UDP-N-acetyl-D-glucosamine dehydrogenase